MKRREIVSVCSLLFWFLAPLDVFGQFPQVSRPEAYNHILRLYAAANYEQALGECRQLIEQDPLWWRPYFRLALTAQVSGRLTEAQAFFAAQLAQTPPNPLGHLGLGIVHHLKKDFAAAVAEDKKCLSMLPEFASGFHWLVLSYRDLQREEEAEAFFLSQVQARPKSAAAHFGLGWHYYQRRRFEAARTEIEQALTIDSQLFDAHFDLGLTYEAQGRYREALAAYRQSSAVAERERDEEAQRIALTNVGNLETRLGYYDEASRTLNRALDLARRCDDILLEEKSLGSLGTIEHRRDKYQAALSYYQQALAVARKVPIGSSPQTHLGNVAALYLDLGNLPAAIEAYQEVQAMALDEGYQGYIWNSLGRAYALQSDWPQAIDCFEHARVIGTRRNSPAILSTALTGLSSIHAHTGDYATALSAIQQAIELGRVMTDPFFDGYVLNQLGALHLRFGAATKAAEVYRQALAIEAVRTSPRTLWRAHSGLAAAYVQLGQLDQAREHYQQAIEAMEDVRSKVGGEEEKAGFFQDKIAVYKKQIALLLDLHARDTKAGYDTQAFHYTERARARAFLDLLAEARVSVEQNATPDLAKRQQELQQSISQLTAQVVQERSKETSKQDKARIDELEKGFSRADADWGDWLRELRRRNPRYAALKYPEPLALAEVQRMLDDKTILLSYSLAEPASFLFAVSRADFQVKRLPSEAALSEGVQKLLAAITDKSHPAPEEYRRQAVRLSEQLLKPVSHMLAGKNALVIVADGALHRLPFDALVAPGAAAQGDLRRLDYLIRRFAISYAPSASVLAGLQNETRETGSKGLIAFGDPVYDERSEGVIASTLRAAGSRLNFQRLPHSHAEIDGIAGLFAADDRELFLGEAASEENVKVPERLSRYRMVHFSTHGYVNEARPRFSGLVLSMPAPTSPQSAIRNPQSEDGLLSAYEIFNLKLKADLVVLSACETGLGKEVKGEGLMSLTRAFIYAGTPSVVVSLWNVNDESAADLMIRFYRHLKTGKTSKAEALRQAQLETIRDNGFPFFWAPFVLVGKQ